MLPWTLTVLSGLPVSLCFVDIERELTRSCLGFPDVFTFMFKHFSDPSVPAPSSALRMTLNTGSSSFFGEKYKLDKVI